MEVKQYLNIVRRVLDTINELEIAKLIDVILDVYETQKTIFVIGNGGSAASASHFAQDLAKGVFLDQSVSKRIRALSLTDNIPYITALANDDGYESIFTAQLRTFAKEHDVLLAISGSGNSKNILNAVQFAKNNYIKVVAVIGYDGGKLKSLADISLHVPLNEMCMVESIHSIIFHYIISNLRMRLTGDAFDETCYPISH